MRERWAAIPDFQRTRGALRFLAACLRAAHREGKSRILLGPGDVLINDAEVRQAFFKEVGQQADFQAVLEHDFIGANARTRQIDERRAKETPSNVMRRPATRLATAILMYSFGGLRREGVKEGEMLPAGITEAELLSVCIGPDLDSTTALACLKELKEQCLYLHFDGARYCFKKDPNVTLLIEQEAELVARDERRVRDRIKEMLETRLAGHHDAVIWPERPGDVPDRQPMFLLAYLPLEFGTKPKAGQEIMVRELFEKYGDQPRKYRNGLGLAVPAEEQIEILRRAVRYLLAAEQIKAKARQLNLTDEQRGQLREREATETAAAELALLKLYLEVWLPKSESGGITVERVAAGGRPLQTMLNAKKQAMIHERVIELIGSVQPRVFSLLKPTKIVELFQLGEGTPPTLGIRTADVVDGFYSFLGFTRLSIEGVISKAIARGVLDGIFGYVAGAAPTLGPDGKYELPPGKARLSVSVAEDEVDLESGYLIMPQAVPSPVQQPISIAGDGGGLTEEPAAPPTPVSAPGQPQLALETSFEVSFAADRGQLFTAWNAVANLADLCGTVKVTLKGASEDGIDKGKLRNGVIEPLQEAGLID